MPDPALLPAAAWAAGLIDAPWEAAAPLHGCPVVRGAEALEQKAGAAAGPPELPG